MPEQAKYSVRKELATRPRRLTVFDPDNKEKRIVVAIGADIETKAVPPALPKKHKAVTDQKMLKYLYEDCGYTHLIDKA